MKDLIAIDSHSHYAFGCPDEPPLDPVQTQDFGLLQKLADATNIGPILCSGYGAVIGTGHIEEGNEIVYRRSMEIDRMYQWVVVDPRNQNTLKQAEWMLKEPKCVGIKLHPCYHKYKIEDYVETICSLASRHHVPLQIHPELEPTYIVPIANRYPDIIFIVAHLGSKAYVDAIDQAEHGNVYTDTSGSASNRNQVIEYAVSRVGSERILFGTDTYAPGFQRGRIEYALISDTDKENILRNNALRLFGHKLK